MVFWPGCLKNPTKSAAVARIYKRFSKVIFGGVDCQHGEVCHWQIIDDVIFKDIVAKIASNGPSTLNIYSDVGKSG